MKHKSEDYKTIAVQNYSEGDYNNRDKKFVKVHIT